MNEYYRLRRLRVTRSCLVFCVVVFAFVPIDVYVCLPPRCTIVQHIQHRAMIRVVGVAGADGGSSRVSYGFCLCPVSRTWFAASTFLPLGRWFLLKCTRCSGSPRRKRRIRAIVAVKSPFGDSRHGSRCRTFRERKGLVRGASAPSLC